MLFLLTLITGRQAVGLGRELFHYKAELLKNNYQRTCARSFIRGFKSGHQELLFNQPVFEYAHKYKDRIALRDRHGQYTYSGLYFSSEQFSKKIRESDNFVVGGRIAFLCPNDASYVLTQWACWISRQIGNYIFVLWNCLCFKNILIISSFNKVQFKFSAVMALQF